MHTPTWIRRAIAASAATAVAATGASVAIGTSALAASDRAALTSVDTTYLSDTLGLPAQTVVETVTYDRFQWLLQQPGQFAFVIGSAYSPGFKDKVVQADLAAKAAGASTIYWFDPNLTGVEGVRNLDTRNPGGINLAANSQAVYGKVWTNVLGKYLGNGLEVTNTNATTVTVAANDLIVNDALDPIWDHRSTQTPAVTSTDSIFFIFDKDNVSGGATDKIVDWVNLTATDATHVSAEVQAAFTASGGGSVIDHLSQFEWWKSSANRKHDLSYGNDAQYGGDILEDADNADGWRIQQLTYPELQHALNKNSADANFVVLLGGTWCHNTRAVIKQVNKEAQDHGVQVVYNFDLVLDGGTVNGANGGGNPIHVRDNRNGGSPSSTNFRPSYVYGDLVNTYFPNVVTQYVPASNGVSYYPGGDLNATPLTVRKAQVPFLLHYERGTGTSPSSTSVQRQWIRSNENGSYTEYMTEWWFTNPTPQLGLDFVIPEDESTLTSRQRTNLNNARTSATFGAEAVAKLTEFFGSLPGVTIPNPTVEAPAVSFGSPAYVTVTVPDTGGHAPQGTATLSIGGLTYSGPVVNNTITFPVAGLAVGAHEYTVTYAGDPHIQGFSRPGSVSVSKAVATVVGAVTQAPSTTASGTYAATVVPTPGLALPTGSVSVTFTNGSATHALSGALSNGVATITVPALTSGTWSIAVAYGGDDVYNGASTSGSWIVAAAPNTSGEGSTPPTGSPSGNTTTPTTTKPASSSAGSSSGPSQRYSQGTASTAVASATQERTDNEDDGTTVEPSPSPEPTVEETEEATAPVDAAEETVDEVTEAQSPSEQSEGISTGVLILGGLVGLSLIGYVAFQLISRGTRAP